MPSLRPVRRVAELGSLGVSTMLALLHSDSGFSIGEVGVVIIIAGAILVFLSPLFSWVADLIYWLVKRRRRRDESGEHSPPPLPPQHSSRHDENA